MIPAPQPRSNKPRSPSTTTSLWDSSTLDMYAERNLSTPLSGDFVVGIYIRPTGVDISDMIAAETEHLGTYRFKSHSRDLQARLIRETENLPFYAAPKRVEVYMIFYDFSCLEDVKAVIKSLHTEEQ